jgi:hypothetical protein
MPSAAYTNPFYDTTGSTFRPLPDGDAYTDAFTLVGGTWTAYAGQQFPASIIGTVHLGPPIGSGKAGEAQGFFKVKTNIYEIDGQPIP